MIIPGFSNYNITEDGVVTNILTGNIVKSRIVTANNLNRYVNVSLVDNCGKRRTHNVLKLLALTYLEKPEEHCMARAKDGDNTHVSLCNVEWVPYAESTRKAWARGKMSDRQPRKSCVTEDSIALLYDTMQLLSTPVTMYALSRELDLPYSTVRYSMYALIKQGKAVKHEKGFELI